MKRTVYVQNGPNDMQDLDDLKIARSNIISGSFGQKPGNEFIKLFDASISLNFGNYSILFKLNSLLFEIFNDSSKVS